MKEMTAETAPELIIPEFGGNRWIHKLNDVDVVYEYGRLTPDGEDVEVLEVHLDIQSMLGVLLSVRPRLHPVTRRHFERLLTEMCS